MFLRRARPENLLDLPRIETERLAIVSLERADAAALHRLTDDPAITGAIDFLPEPFTLADAEGLIAGARHGRDRFLGAWLRQERMKDRTLAGVVGAHLRGEGTIEIGYWVGGAARGRGLAAEAVGGVLGLLRGRFPRRTILAECRPGNVASWGLLHKLGFRETGAEGHRPGRRQLVLEGS
ncbi:RimJ/RimL family protein N-acetyltransferase [Methylorubrum rhodinum]|uniref:RimJ/RimL family protein N-acetyltransferase n=1 Tax=Methylorubrum rhodinum TaxID=29428 RepID=A0A840ZM86_9HYPH|nr:GNAT family N-acetyltransferase [Methylorubrum rhodinum]MBB5758041.1 RimJ/RimL family protein N-acetyltransferase [Methylorubrum rhodinum]